MNKKIKFGHIQTCENVRNKVQFEQILRKNILWTW